MSSGKIGALIFYAVLALLAFTQAGTQVGTVVNWIIVGLVLVWLGEGQIFRFATTVLVLGALAWWSRWAFITEPPRRQQRPPPTLGSPGGQDATPEPGVSPPVSAGRNRAVLLMRAAFVVIGLLWANRRRRFCPQICCPPPGNSGAARAGVRPL